MREHRAIAMKVLGRSLKGDERVHHIDGNGCNNSHDNLVICPDQAYHVLLHTRTAALDNFGDVHARCCYICKQYDDTTSMTFMSRGKDSFYYHKKCAMNNYIANREQILANRRRRRAAGKRN